MWTGKLGECKLKRRIVWIEVRTRKKRRFFAVNYRYEGRGQAMESTREEVGSRIIGSERRKKGERDLSNYSK